MLRPWKLCTKSAPTAILVVSILFLAGCWDGGGASTKVYSGGGPLPEESEVLEKLKTMPKVGRYAIQESDAKPGKKLQKSKRAR